MCNLYRLQASEAELVAHFGAVAPAGLIIPPETKPGGIGLVPHVLVRLDSPQKWESESTR